MTTGTYQIQLTEQAATIIHDAFESEKVDKANAYVRIGAHPGGCSGYKYDMDFADGDAKTPEDMVFESQGVQILVNKTQLEEILGSLEIGYRNADMVSAGFTFTPLTGGAQCGCGESFTPVKDLMASS